MNHSSLKTIKNLSDYLRCDEQLLDSIVNNSSSIFDRTTKLITVSENGTDKELLRIRKIFLKKKKDPQNFRIVYSIQSNFLKDLNKVLNTYLNDLYLPLPVVHSYLKGRNNKTNASLHLAKNVILSLDIKNFFDSISSKMIVETFKSLGYQDSISEALCKLTTIDGKLGQGFSTSPTLANIVVYDMDKKLVEYCEKLNIIYSRYADDLTFSSNANTIDSTEIELIINQFNFELNHKKTKLMFRGNKQFVTGLTVFDKISPRIPKRIKRNLRLEVYFITTRGYKAHALKRLNYSYSDYNDFKEIREEVQAFMSETSIRITGWINYINSIEPNFSEKLKHLKKK
jgi:retron-type reverse transcriptase